MEDAPPVFYMGVDSNGRCVAPRIKPGLPHPFGGLHAHHVRRCQIGPPPGGGNRVSLHEFQHSLAGLAQTPFVPRPAHTWRMLVADNCGIMRAHSTAVRLVPYDAGIDHQQLVGRARLTSEHDPAKAHLGVNYQNHFRQLNLTDAVIQSRAQLGHFWVFVLCGQWRQMEFIIHAQYATAGCSATASTPAVTLTSKGFKKVAALLGNDRRA